MVERCMKKSVRSNKRIILVVDDEQDICELIAQYLDARGFVTIRANSGKEAIAKVKRVTPDLIILDVKMPEMGGFECLQRIKSNPVYSKVPVIMLTVKSDPIDVDKGVLLGADFYLPKPFGLENLFSFIEIGLGEKKI